ncbi:hypothetical protein Cva_00546 [Caedimonas varicaedens]|uniref:Bacterial toxin 28 domain-containing protein n=1 Tax=Caedimonas varicaedens TaxID=1629334 RepID=A0A0K8MBJ2_9PROT|nr:hypothetical protein Cva_00546 [Caedimonas varicaedens]
MNESIMFIKEKLSQKFSFGKRFDKKSVKRLITHLVLLAFINQNLAFATNGIIELDFEGSENPQRLHTIIPSSKIQDVSYIEIDAEQKQATLYKKGDGEEVHPLAPFSLPSVAVYQGDVAHNLWGLEQETIKLFLQASSAWLIPLDEDGYKLEFKGRLLGGMKQSGGNQKNMIYPCSKAPKTDTSCWVKGGNFYAPDSSWIGKNPGNISIISNPNYSQTGGGGGSKGTRSGGSGWQGILGRGWAEIKANGDKARDRMRQQQENLKKLSTVGQSVEIYKRPEIIIPESPFPRVQTYQPSTKEPFLTGPSLEAQYSRLRVLYNMADRWEWSEIYEYAKVIGVSREEIKKYNLTQRHAKGAGFSSEYFKEVTEEEERNALKKEEQEEERKETIRQYEQESSEDAASLFHHVPSQYEVTPKYFAQCASDAGMTPSQALNIILNPDADNFYDRARLASRQKWLGGPQNTTVFELEGITNAQAHEYIKQGYHEGDMPKISNNLISQRGASLFEGVTHDYFVAQAEKAKMTPSQALRMIFNPTPDNFYDRVRLASQQNWLGGKNDTTAFEFEDLTNAQAYQYIVDGYKPHDFPTLSNRLISQRGAALFDVEPQYFSRQAEKAGMTSIEALNILMNPALENFYDRVMLVSRDNWLGGPQDGTAFELEELTNEEAYQYLSEGYKPHDFPTLSHRLVSQRLGIEADQTFDDQVLEDWGVNDWRENPRNELEVPQFMRVGLTDYLAKKAFEKIVRTFTPKTQELLKGLHRYKRELFAREKMPKSKTTLKAAEQELKGKQIPLAEQRGRIYDHVEKVKSSQNGLVRLINDIKARLGYPELPQIERQALENQLSKTSKLLDHTEKFVPRSK